MKIKKIAFPQNSLLIGTSYDYTDSYCGNLNAGHIITSDEVGKAFFSSSPKWIGILLMLRNKLVSIFGLKTGDSSKKIHNYRFEKGDRIGLFKVFDKNIDELLLGEDDKHLDFRVSLLLEPQSQHKRLIISTTVIFNNWFGKLYFLPVKQFHKLIVRNMLKQTLKELKH
ncbi:DUF2867 domain-containing protein [Aquimarina mytili]|uniref:DUF2867 domain-containing protein n=1 Tax=Aquimarina mytili TaxID=874423 RepID=A0A937DBB5_9FLAO|nr:DUF2867 domain-containing protein [Aquimarina mytili]MBL0684433.1 DUF2867 domain-containing protein [Aquimarina mytili]